MAEDKKEKPTFQRENLVVLQFSGNGKYPVVVPLEQAVGELILNLEKGTWQAKENGRSSLPRRIGQSESSNPQRVIGVFDRSDFEQLSSMVSGAIYRIEVLDSSETWED